MSYCEFHQGRDSTVICVNCGRLMCDQCSGTHDGTGLCPVCKGEVRHASMNDPWVVSDSPWSSGPLMDGTVRQYIQIGFIGSLLSVIQSILSGIQIFLIYFTSYYFEMLLMLSLPLLIVTFLFLIFIGIGFLGLHHKYNDSACKASFLMSIFYVIAYALYNGFAILSALPSSMVYVVFSYGIALVSFIALLMMSIALWSISLRTPRPEFTKILAILNVAGTLVIGFLGIFPIIVTSIVTSLLMVYFFQLEQSGGVKQVVASW